MPVFDADQVRNLVFFLSYTQHGGSGLGWSRDTILELDWDQVLWYAERLEQERERECKALKGK